MITEIAQIDVLPGHEDDFEKAVAEARPHFLDADGCHGIDLHRSLEHPTRYRLMVRWETVEHHTVTFRASDGFARWRALAGPHFATPPRVEHVVSVLAPPIGSPRPPEGSRWTE
ncbi:antibiotic biosynthesis monooxygenase [Streptomyces kunmingensis]|uniref:Antibiotic biosynthesis monooxygenase n=1 Tax=Streptomyces kunmingensis TaxID=68225 RepID=A0ABU6C5U7_9ACTN|nr:antibiotic biosynthesis monooxygenase family protein [Streptomyces kunmingensis]MEB3959953.1 antibiotic biosynthesis monooxygenase [Streptomyces kunmingensis]